MTLQIILIAVLATGCGATLVQPIAPQPRGGTCESAHAKLAKLGGCGVNLPRFVQDCHDRQIFDASRGRTLNLDCITESETCAVALSCRGS